MTESRQREMKHFWNLLVLLVCVCVVAAGSPKERNSTKTKVNKIANSTRQSNRKPNIVIIVTDDQDVQLGSLESMPRTLQHFRQSVHGVEFRNAFVTTPLCCPSRTSLLTGIYAHNHGVMSNEGECGSVNWRRRYERRTFATLLQEGAGYATAYFGKYLNRYDGSYVPSGWSTWTALKGNSRYYNYTLISNVGQKKGAPPLREYHGSRYETDYLTDVLANRTLSFIREHAARPDAADVPFLAVMSVPAPHGPETAAPRYAATLNNVTTHRTASFNTAPSGDKQWLLAQTSPMSATAERYTDALHARRLETLRSVDDAVERLFAQLTRLALLNNTYVFYVSDNGFHLGQFGLVKGKLTPFEFDSRVPLLVRTPSARGALRLEPVLNVDIMPTILDLAGVPVPSSVDGTSFARLLGHPVAPRVPERRQDPEWREAFLIERGNYTNFNLSFSSLHFVDNTADSLYTRKSESSQRVNALLSDCDCERINARAKMRRKRVAGRSTARPATVRRPVTPTGKRDPTRAPVAKRVTQTNQKQRSRTTDSTAAARKASLKELLRPFVRDPAFTDCLFGDVSRAKGRQSPLALNRTLVNRCIRLASSVPKRSFVTRLRNRLAAVSKARLNAVITQLVSERQRAYAGWKQALKTQTRRASTRKRSSASRSSSPAPSSLLPSTSKRTETSRRVVKSVATTAATTRRPSTVIVSRATNASTVQRTRTSRTSIITTTTAATTRSTSTVRSRSTKRSAARTTRSSIRSRSRRELNVVERPTLAKRSQKRSNCARKCKAAERRALRETKPCYQPDMSCMLVDTTFGQGGAASSKESQFCYCANSNNNSYACLRVLRNDTNFVYCEFLTGFVSFFDMRRDPHQLNNVVSKLSEPTRRQLHEMVGELARCKGSQCNSMRVRLPDGNSQSQSQPRSGTGSERRVAVSEAKPTDSGTRSGTRRSTAPGKQARTTRGSSRAQTKPAAQKRGS